MMKQSKRGSVIVQAFKCEAEIFTFETAVGFELKQKQLKRSVKCIFILNRKLS